jgi:hypothetical protein
MDAKSDLVNLYLHWLARLRRRPRYDDQVAAGRVRLAANDLADRADGVDDRRARRIGHEARQRLQLAAAIGTV